MFELQATVLSIIIIRRNMPIVNQDTTIHTNFKNTSFKMLTRHIAFSGQNRIGNSVWIFAAFFAAALAFDFAMQQTAAADETMTTFFSDNYNVYGNKKEIEEYAAKLEGKVKQFESAYFDLQMENIQLKDELSKLKR